MERPSKNGVDSPVRQAIRALPEHHNAAFLEAQRVCPKLVDVESPENRFLAVEDGNVKKAAWRLAMYWKTRKDIFAVRAFLPLEQSGTGALDEKALSIMNTGALVPTKCDESGRPVLSFDPSRLEAVHSFPVFDDSRLHVAFFLLSIAAENPFAQSQGVVALAHLKESPRVDIHRHAMQMIKECLPIRKLEYHLVMLPSTSRFGVFTERIIDLFQLAVEPFTSFISVHRGSTDAEVLGKLKARGFKTIPVWMGGTYSMQDYEDWRSRRKDIEQQRFLTAADRASLRREADAMRARRKRDAQRKEEKVLCQEVDELRAVNEKLKHENDQLAMMLACAQAQIFGPQVGNFGPPY